MAAAQEAVVKEVVAMAAVAMVVGEAMVVAVAVGCK